jgi:hypothetical protein
LLGKPNNRLKLLKVQVKIALLNPNSTEKSKGIHKPILKLENRQGKIKNSIIEIFRIKILSF